MGLGAIMGRAPHLPVTRRSYAPKWVSFSPLRVNFLGALTLEYRPCNRPEIRNRENAFGSNFSHRV